MVCEEEDTGEEESQLELGRTGYEAENEVGVPPRSSDGDADPIEPPGELISAGEEEGEGANWPLRFNSKPLLRSLIPAPRPRGDRPSRLYSPSSLLT
jgi:hypothetical protein